MRHTSTWHYIAGRPHSQHSESFKGFPCNLCKQGSDIYPDKLSSVQLGWAITVVLPEADELSEPSESTSDLSLSAACTQPMTRKACRAARRLASMSFAPRPSPFNSPSTVEEKNLRKYHKMITGVVSLRHWALQEMIWSGPTF